MSFTSNPFIVGSRSRTDASAVPETMTAPTARPPPDILTYCYGSRMVYVSPGRDYDRAIDIAVESFPELRDIERDRICLEVHVVHSHQRTVEIGRTAWPFLVPTLARFDLVGIRVSPLSMSASASSSSGVEPTPYAWETDWPGNSDTRGSQTNLVAYRAQMPYSPSPSRPHPHTTRVVVDLVPSKSSRDRYSPQPRQRHHF